jgi:signal transduction histidine kinase
MQPEVDENALVQMASTRDPDDRQLDVRLAQAEARIAQLKQQVISIQEAERKRIAQDLHDDIGQRMTALILALNNLRGGIPQFEPQLRAGLTQAIWQLEDVMQQVRQLAHQLRPPNLESTSLEQALEALCAVFALQDRGRDLYLYEQERPGPRLYQPADRGSLNIDFSCISPLPAVPDNQALAVYRFVQEALTNIARHARASAVWVNLDYEASDLTISVEDDGVGFDPQSRRSGMGLQGICERFEMLNGSIEIDSSPGRGTRISGSLPVTANENREPR